jgi:arginine/serine-rich splicing factor 4/5/6
VFCGNFEYDASERDLYRLFEKYGPVERIDMKTGEAAAREPAPRRPAG